MSVRGPYRAVSWPNVLGGLTPFPQTFVVVAPSGQISLRDKVFTRGRRIKCKVTPVRAMPWGLIFEVGDPKSAISLKRSRIKAHSRRDLNFQAPIKYSNAGLYYDLAAFVSRAWNGRAEGSLQWKLEERPWRRERKTGRYIDFLGCTCTRTKLHKLLWCTKVHFVGRKSDINVNGVWHLS